jgi:hypothetical protein
MKGKGGTWKKGRKGRKKKNVRKDEGKKKK